MAEQESLRQGGLEFTESSVMVAIADNYADELQIVDNAFRCILEGLTSINKLPDSEQEIEIQEGRMLLAIRIFKSVRSARLLCQFGYYEQSLTLLRSSMEHLLVAYDITIRRGTLDALKEGFRFNVGKLRYADMLDRVAREIFDSNFKNGWNITYGLLNEYVHPGGARRQQISLSGNETGYTLPITTHYDKNLADVTLFFIEHNLLGLFRLVKEMTTLIGNEWESETTLEDLHSMYKSRLSDQFPLAPPKGKSGGGKR